MLELTKIRISVCYSDFLAFILSTTLSGQENPRASSLSLKFDLLTLPSLKTRQLKERLLYTDIFRAPSRAVRALLQRKTSVTIILNAPFCKRCVSNNSALSSSALHSALRASLCSSEWQSLLLYALFEIGRARSEYQWFAIFAILAKKKENLGVPNGAWKSSLLDDWLFWPTIVPKF